MKSVKIKVPYTNFPLKSIQSVGYSEASLGKIVEPGGFLLLRDNSGVVLRFQRAEKRSVDQWLSQSRRWL